MLTSKTALLAVSVLVSTPLFGAEPLTRGERDRVMSHMHGTRKMFLDAVAGLTPEQWNFKAAPEKWSIAECAEHIAASETFIFGLVEKLAASPGAPAEQLEKTKGKDEAVIKLVPDRTSKFQAPEPIRPRKLAANPQEYIEKFKAARDQNIAFLEKTDAVLRDKIAPHPAMGPLDAYQWVLLMSAHTERHTLQILEVKAANGYPKS
jgi:hypothetical protein